MISEQVSKECEALLTQLEGEQERIQALINGLRLLLDQRPRPDAAPATRPKRNEEPCEPDEDEVRSKHYASEKWADRKVESLKEQGIRATKKFNEGVWIVSWKGEPR